MNRVNIFLFCLYNFYRIQQLDGGFFEKFGSLLREQSYRAEEEEDLEKEKIAATAAEIKVNEESDEAEAPKTEDDLEKTETENDAVRDSDSEQEDTETNYIAVGWNVRIKRVCILYGKSI